MNGINGNVNSHCCSGCGESFLVAATAVSIYVIDVLTLEVAWSRTCKCLKENPTILITCLPFVQSNLS